MGWGAMVWVRSIELVWVLGWFELGRSRCSQVGWRWMGSGGVGLLFFVVVLLCFALFGLAGLA